MVSEGEKRAIVESWKQAIIEFRHIKWSGKRASSGMCPEQKYVIIFVPNRFSVAGYRALRIFDEWRSPNADCGPGSEQR
jgi:hypothetical protein